MAEKVTREPTQASAPPGADDLAILYPNIDLEVAGEKITMREYPFLTGLRLQARLAPLMKAIASAAMAAEDLDMDRVADVLAEHADDLPTLISAACDQPVEWVEGLSDTDGNIIMQAWWAANADFFVRRVKTALSALALEKMRNAGPVQPPGGQTSTRH